MEPSAFINMLSGAASDTLSDNTVYYSNSVAILNIKGVLGYDEDQVNIQDLYNDIQALEQEQDITTIVFDISSPGGVATGINHLFNIINTSTKRTLAFTDSLCASAAYWVASACDEIYATLFSEVGSIGVYSYYDFETGALRLQGFEPTLIKAKESPDKAIGIMPFNDSEKAIVQNEVDVIYNDFRSSVLSKRKNTSPDALTGITYPTEQGIQMGLLDGVVSNMDELIEFIN